MKQSILQSELSNTVSTIARQQHKSLIPLGESGRPMLYYLLRNARTAGITTVYLITSKDNQGFKEYVKEASLKEGRWEVNIKIAVQHVPENAQKPQGTADAVLQCLDQYPELLAEQFIVCNGDNLYSVKTLKALMEMRKAPHALIAKPEDDTIPFFKDATGKLRVSMNIFSFQGAGIYPFLKACQPHPSRLEKELPEAVRNLIREQPKGMLCVPCEEHVPDLTSAGDLKDFDGFEGK